VGVDSGVAVASGVDAEASRQDHRRRCWLCALDSAL
jgi:hypothetical protein